MFTQGDPMYPTIFNVVVDTVICHWATVVAGEKVGPEGFGRALQKLTMIFYMDGGILASTQPSRIKEALYATSSRFWRLIFGHEPLFSPILTLLWYHH